MIEKAFSRYGHIELWNKIDHIVIKMRFIRGLIPRLKGIGHTFPHFGELHIFPHQQRIVFFSRDKTELGTYEGGTVILKNQTPIQNYRKTFSGLYKYRRWNCADAIYFFGYAITTYTSVPFLFSHFPYTEYLHQEGFRVEVDFPKEFHTHGPHQSFIFDHTGLLTRHDYHAEILGWFAWGAHFTTDFKDINGFPIACTRKVFARIGNYVTPLPILQASMAPVAVVLKST